MSDIQKLNKVIDSLEEQSARVNEFNGVLSAVNDAKAEIASTKETFAELATEQKGLVSEGYKRFEEYGDTLASIESKLSAMEGNQQRAISQLSKLKFVTPEQFEAGRDKILLRISEQSFVTPEQLDKAKNSLEKALAEQINQSNSRLEAVLAKQAQSIQSFRTVVVLGMLILAGGIAYLAKDAFI